MAECQGPNTQELSQIADSAWDNLTDQNSQPSIWARLHAKRKKIKSGDVFGEQFSIGRGKTTNLCINEAALKEEFFLKISKTHFIITREKADCLGPAYIHDHSLNGTFLNGELIGQNKKRILQDDDIISLSYPHWKDLRPSSTADMPKDIRKKYYVSKRIGAGAGGCVYLVYDTQSCLQYAMKQVKKNVLKEVAIIKNLCEPERVMNEAKIMKQIQHPCIVKLHELWDRPDSVYMILEYMAGGDLLTRIVSQKKLPEKISMLFFYQMCHAVKYLHDKGITHRDLKPDNVLLQTNDEETLLKVSDFGLSKAVNGDSILKTICGTPLYVAPEVLCTSGKQAYTKKVDIWSLGVVLFTCLSGTLPFSNEYGSPACEQIKNGDFQFLHSSWRDVSSVAKQLIVKMLSVDQNIRPDIDYVLGHEWLQDPETIRKARDLMNIPANMYNEALFLEPPLKKVRR